MAKKRSVIIRGIARNYTTTKTGAFALIDTLVRNNTRYIFGYPGGAILPIYDELYRWEERFTIKPMQKHSSLYKRITLNLFKEFIAFLAVAKISL